MGPATASWLFLVASVVGAWFTFNAYHPMPRRRHRAVLSFFAGWLTAELAIHHVVWQAVMTAVFVRAGALHAWPGVVGLGIMLGSWVGLARCYGAAWGAERIVEGALREGLGDEYREPARPGVRG